MGKYQRLPNGSYMSQPRHPVTGKRVTLTAETVRELEDKLARLRTVRSDMRLGMTQTEAEARLRPAAGVVMLVDEMFERYLAGLGRSREKGEWAWRNLEPYFGGKTAWELTGDVMRAWEVEARKKGYAKATVSLFYDLLAAAVNLQVPTVIPGLPWGKWRPARENKDELYIPKRPALWDLETFKAFAAIATADDEENWRAGRYSCYSTVLMVLVLTGMRQGEAAGLGWDHVSIDDQQNDVLFIEWQAGKGWTRRHADRPRDEPKDGARRQRMHPVVVELLQRQRAQLRERGWYRDDGPVFPAPGGGWLRTGIVVKPKRIKRWAEKVGVPEAERWCAHSFRHSFVMLEIEANGGDLVAVMERSGHSDLRVIRGYMHKRGRLMAPPKVGMLPGEATALLPALPSSGVELGANQLPEASRGLLSGLVADTGAALERAEEERRETKKSKADDTYDTFEEIFRRWDTAGRPGKQPPEITAKARRAYLKGYNRGVRQRATAERCRAMGKQDRGRLIGAWTLALKRLDKRSDSNSGEAAQ